MPVTKSAKKAFRKSLKHKALNLSYKNKIQAIKKQIRKELTSKNKEAAKKLLPGFYKIVDKAAKSHAIRKNRASRLKSRIAHRVNKTA